MKRLYWLGRIWLAVVAYDYDFTWKEGWALAGKLVQNPGLVDEAGSSSEH